MLCVCSLLGHRLVASGTQGRMPTIMSHTVMHNINTQRSMACSPRLPPFINHPVTPACQKVHKGNPCTKLTIGRSIDVVSTCAHLLLAGYACRNCKGPNHTTNQHDHG